MLISYLDHLQLKLGIKKLFDTFLSFTLIWLKLCGQIFYLTSKLLVLQRSRALTIQTSGRSQPLLNKLQSYFKFKFFHH